MLLGDSATCQSRISYAEMHTTAHEDAPCPAAHVVVMSQCESCGECHFKDVTCISHKGITKSSYDEFWYKKYEESGDGALSEQGGPRGFAAVPLLSTIVPGGVTGLLLVVSVGASLTLLALAGTARTWRRATARDFQGFAFAMEGHDPADDPEHGDSARNLLCVEAAE